eukprot:7607841-Lingulodinium_polyedra.AAC.1
MYTDKLVHVGAVRAWHSYGRADQPNKSTRHRTGSQCAAAPIASKHRCRLESSSHQRCSSFMLP